MDNLFSLLSDVEPQGNFVQILPAGPHIKAVDGRSFLLENPHQLVSTINERGVDVMVDYEHESVKAAKSGGKVLAAGWLSAFTVKDDGSVWAKAMWTEAAQAHIDKKEYRYLSPTLNHDSSGKIQRIFNVALTNNPALTMLALCSTASDEPYVPQERELDSVAMLVGLDAGATLSEIQSKLINAQTERERLSVCTAVNSAYEQYVIPATVRNELEECCSTLGIERFNNMMATMGQMAFMSAATFKQGQIASLSQQLGSRQRTPSIPVEAQRVCDVLGIDYQDYVNFNRR